MSVNTHTHLWQIIRCISGRFVTFFKNWNHQFCREWIFPEYIFIYIKLLCFIIYKTIASQCSSYHIVPHYSQFWAKIKMTAYIHKYDRRSCKHRNFWLKALHRQCSCVMENVILMRLRSCYFVTDRTLSAKRISLGNFFFHVITMTYFFR